MICLTGNWNKSRDCYVKDNGGHWRCQHPPHWVRWVFYIFWNFLTFPLPILWSVLSVVFLNFPWLGHKNQIPWLSTEFCAVLSVLAHLTLTGKQQSEFLFPLIFPTSRMIGNSAIVSNAWRTGFATGRRPAFSSLIPAMSWINENFHENLR
jgi:hypothetical protein